MTRRRFRPLLWLTRLRRAWRAPAFDLCAGADREADARAWTALGDQLAPLDLAAARRAWLRAMALDPTAATPRERLIESGQPRQRGGEAAAEAAREERDA